MQPIPIPQQCKVGGEVLGREILARHGDTVVGQAQGTGQLVFDTSQGRLDAGDAVAVEQLELGWCTKRLEAQLVRDWLDSEPVSPRDYPNVAQALAQWLADGRRESIHSLSERLWTRAGVRAPTTDHRLISLALAAAQGHGVFERPCVLLSGGETTVTVKPLPDGEALGRGGRAGEAGREGVLLREREWRAAQAEAAALEVQVRAAEAQHAEIHRGLTGMEAARQGFTLGCDADGF